MSRILALLLLVSPFLTAAASEQSSCSANKGAFLTGTVTSAPKFASGSSIDGVETSHTHVNLKADQDGKTYDVAMDNVYAVDYVKNAKAVPNSLKAITVGSRLEVCGEKYTSGVGIHWVHSNCGAVPTATAPNGWVKQLSSSGSVGANLERSQTYCYLWN
ncbi:hypothetical protein SAMN05192549_104108 [Duganella sacchari]|uniref:Uncharacterized protein n=1 Tax=Duganella sacchari TaxID=551987 RepID=A0A1M7NPY7_9BURK|nr:hypothetical protein [Duganella sacchari]SHN06043.1 hypothetical protein SAMN05192549_104108 [Duganella sacchari]